MSTPLSMKVRTGILDDYAAPRRSATSRSISSRERSLPPVATYSSEIARSFRPRSEPRSPFAVVGFFLSFRLLFICFHFAALFNRRRPSALRGGQHCDNLLEGFPCAFLTRIFVGYRLRLADSGELFEQIPGAAAVDAEVHQIAGQERALLGVVLSFHPDVGNG